MGTSIEWTDSTWNPVTGCTKVSLGCQHCYAERMSSRLRAMAHPRYANGFRVTLHEDLLDLPRTWAKPRMVFVNSMGDLFHGDVPLWFIRRVFESMRRSRQHVFQILTKRAGRLLQLADKLDWSPNIWMGVTVESQAYVSRIDSLRRIPAAVRFVSLEPLLGPIEQLELDQIDWVIVGGESGPGARPMRPEWVRSVREKCLQADAAFFFKQWGGVNKKRAGRVFDGRTWEEYPARHTPLPHASRLSAPPTEMTPWRLPG